MQNSIRLVKKLYKDDKVQIKIQIDPQNLEKIRTNLNKFPNYITFEEHRIKCENNNYMGVIGIRVQKTRHNTNR
jgi:hypothetical protein